jgi:DNA-binding CsgD family transcriptional regulator
MTISLDPTENHMLFTTAEVDDLTERERDVLELITNGYSNEQISRMLYMLYLSINSVKTYVRSGYRKIGAETRSHAVIWGVRHGLLRDWTHPEAR